MEVTVCFGTQPNAFQPPVEGDAGYYDVQVNGETKQDAAWFYPAPKPAAANIKDRVAFWKGVTVS